MKTLKNSQKFNYLLNKFTYTLRIARLGQPAQENRIRTTSTGWLERIARQDSRDRIAKTGQPGQDSGHRTAATGQGHSRMDSRGTDWTGRPECERKVRTVAT